MATPWVTERHGYDPTYTEKKQQLAEKEAALQAENSKKKVGGQAVLGRQTVMATPWLTERHGYDPTSARRRLSLTACRTQTSS